MVEKWSPMISTLNAFLTLHRRKIIAVVAVGMAVTHLTVAVTGAVAGLLLKAIHLCFAMVLAFLIFPHSNARKDTLSIFDVVLSLTSLVVFGYIIVDFDHVQQRMLFLDDFTSWQYAMGVLAILLVLEGGRRALGWTLSVLAVVMLFYASFCEYFPGIMRVKGWRFREIVEVLYFSGEGILGIPIGVSATFVFLFVLIGSFLNRGGGGNFFLGLATSLTRGSKGGPAKVAVISSGLFGSISGSAVANVVSTGTLTIPLMKRMGYRPEVAGAIEAVASSGGQLMPPVMGAAAFVMAEITSTPYSDIIKYALLPALLYYTAVFAMVHLEALKNRMEMVEIPRDSAYLKYTHMIIPMIVMLVMIIIGYTPYLSATTAIFLSIPLSFLRKESRMGIVGILGAMADGAKESIPIAMACALSGLIIGCLWLTGLSLNFASVVFSLFQGIPFLGLILVAIVCIILGLGLPTVAAYIVVAAVGVAPLVKLGFPEIGAHFFVFYFCILAVITPPVALAAYAGATIAGADFFRTGITAVKFGFIAYLIPFMLIYNPELLLIGEPLQILRALITALIGTLSLGIAVQGWMFARVPVWQRLLLFGAGPLLIVPDWQTDLLGVVLFLIPVVVQWRLKEVRAREA